MSGILTSTQASGSAVTGHLCPKTDVVASKWIAIATITAVFGHTSPNEPSWRHKMLESADLARLPSDRSRKWEIPVQTSKLVTTHPAILLAPSIERLLRHADLTDCVCYRLTLAL
jgi:hypothetical protein